MSESMQARAATELPHRTEVDHALWGEALNGLPTGDVGVGMIPVTPCALAIFATSRGFERGLAAALSVFDCAAFAVDRAGNVVFANETAEELLGEGLSIRRGTLGFASKEHRAAFARLMQSVLRNGATAGETETIALARPNRKWPLLVRAIPIALSGFWFGLPVGAAALVIVVDPERNRDANPERELRLLGLTAAEARLAALIGGGLSRAAAAETLGLSPSTVSDTVKDIYSKLDIKRQSELVRLVDRLAVLSSRRKKNGAG